MLIFLHSLLWFGFISTRNYFKGGQQMALELKVSPGWDAHWPAEKATMRMQMQMGVGGGGALKAAGGCSSLGHNATFINVKSPGDVEPWGLIQEPGGKTSFGSIEVVGAPFCICQAIELDSWTQHRQTMLLLGDEVDVLVWMSLKGPRIDM